MNRKNYIFITVIISSILMSLVDGVLCPPYFIKSLIKVVLFLIVPLGYFVFFSFGLEMMKSLFVVKKKEFKIAVVLGVGIFLIILLAYFLFRNWIDFDGIRNSLTSGAGVNSNNFVFVALYISFVNSLLEEFFFRGYAFLLFKQEVSTRFAYGFSALLFAFYHVGMTITWFNPIIYLLAMMGLFIGGLIFNSLNDHSRSIYPSWFVHMCANLAINTVGFILFGII